MKFLTVILCLFGLGNVAFALNPRIVGGNVAQAGEFPSAAAINIHTTDGTYFCGGALLSNQWVLTAGQCVYNAVSFTITLGTINLGSSEPNRVIVAAEEYYIHPDFDPETLLADLGLIKFRLPISLSDYIQPLPLPEADVANYAVVVAIGWGQITDSSAGLVTTLNRVTLTVLSNEECRLTFGNQVLDTMVCVDGIYNQGTCNGDSGGPLIQYVHGNEPAVLGVSSFFSGNGCESTDPSGFTRVFPYVDWIRTVTEIP